MRYQIEQAGMMRTTPRLPRNGRHSPILAYGLANSLATTQCIRQRTRGSRPHCGGALRHSRRTGARLVVDLRRERSAACQLILHRNGYILPDIRFRFDGAAFEVTAQGRIHHNPGVRFWDTGTEVMNRSEAEAALGSLVETILQRLQSLKLGDTSAALRWTRRVQALPNDPEEAAFCESAGALGLDPYKIGEDAAETIEGAAALFDGEALTELLAGASGTDTRSILDWVGTVESRRPYCARIADLRQVAQEAGVRESIKADEESWALGYRRGFRATRSVLNLKQNDRLGGFPYAGW